MSPSKRAFEKYKPRGLFLEFFLVNMPTFLIHVSLSLQTPPYHEHLPTTDILLDLSSYLLEPDNTPQPCPSMVSIWEIFQDTLSNVEGGE